MAKNYYCIKCDAPLNKQSGFSSDRSAWTCKKCGEILTRSNILAGEAKNGEWRCEECGAVLNTQYGFSTDYTRWMCTKCMHTNVKEEDTNINKCPSCGSLLTGQEGFSEYSNEFICEDCDATLYRDFSFEPYRVREDIPKRGSNARTYNIDTERSFDTPKISITSFSYSAPESVTSLDLNVDTEMPSVDSTSPLSSSHLTDIPDTDKGTKTEHTSEFLNTDTAFSVNKGEITGDSIPSESHQSSSDLKKKTDAPTNYSNEEKTSSGEEAESEEYEKNQALIRRKHALVGRLDTRYGKCYFCPKCRGVVNEQYGFKLTAFQYDCKRCQSTLYYLYDEDRFVLRSSVPGGVHDPLADEAEENSSQVFRYSKNVNDALASVLRVTRKIKNRKLAFIKLIICLVLGIFGAHKFVEGKFFMAILYFFTWGLFGIGWLFDLLGYFNDLIKDDK